VVTVCDREADLYDFFKLSHQLDAAVLVRATQNRTVNRKSRYAEKDVSKLWDYMRQQGSTFRELLVLSTVKLRRCCSFRVLNYA